MRKRPGSPKRPRSAIDAFGFKYWSRWLCGLSGHNVTIHFEKARIAVQCISCGYESPGWNLRGPDRSVPDLKSLV